MTFSFLICHMLDIVCYHPVCIDKLFHFTCAALGFQLFLSYIASTIFSICIIGLINFHSNVEDSLFCSGL
jgi:hypothetical protein